MPVITIEFFPGRSETVKQQISSVITDLMVNVAKTGSPEGVYVIFRETPPECWAMNGILQSLAKKNE
jgi:phenylpyruvate tautomerase PptA (4-oxalocrotonate tautomerase family)